MPFFFFFGSDRIISNKKRILKKVLLNTWIEDTLFYPFSSKHLLEVWFRKNKWADSQLLSIIGSTPCMEIKIIFCQIRNCTIDFPNFCCFSEIKLPEGHSAHGVVAFHSWKSQIWPQGLQMAVQVLQHLFWYTKITGLVCKTEYNSVTWWFG